MRCTRENKTREPEKKGKKEKIWQGDCYTGNGEEYIGLVAATESGRNCMNWIQNGKFGSNDAGIGNHNFCRNPRGEHDRPWCFTIDPGKEWDYCKVPECVEVNFKGEPWLAPEGSKSEEAEAEGPCEYIPPKKPPFTTFKEGRACKDKGGSKWWLIGMKRIAVEDNEGCFEQCQARAGSEFFTFFSN